MDRVNCNCCFLFVCYMLRDLSHRVALVKIVVRLLKKSFLQHYSGVLG
jgi:hypothetical protein